MTTADPPYLYDDPRFIYDEPCLFYDGGFDAQCLINLNGRVVGIPRKVGRSSWKDSGKRRPEPKIVEIIFCITPRKVNDEYVQEKTIKKKYKIKEKSLKIEVYNIKAHSNIVEEKQNINVYMEVKMPKIDLPTIVVENKNIKFLQVKTIVSGSMSYIKNLDNNKPSIIITSKPTTPSVIITSMPTTKKSPT